MKHILGALLLKTCFWSARQKRQSPADGRGLKRRGVDDGKERARAVAGEGRVGKRLWRKSPHPFPGEDPVRRSAIAPAATTPRPRPAPPGGKSLGPRLSGPGHQMLQVGGGVRR